MTSSSKCTDQSELPTNHILRIASRTLGRSYRVSRIGQQPASVGLPSGALSNLSVATTGNTRPESGPAEVAQTGLIETVQSTTQVEHINTPETIPVDKLSTVKTNQGSSSTPGNKSNCPEGTKSRANGPISVASTGIPEIWVPNNQNIATSAPSFLIRRLIDKNRGRSMRGRNLRNCRVNEDATVRHCPPRKLFTVS